MLTPSWAVTTVVMVLGPTANGRLGDAAPDATVLPLIAIVAKALLRNASTLIDVVVLDTDEV